MILEGFDASYWQDPDKWDWIKLKDLNQQLIETKGTKLLFIPRATYGKGTEDKKFVRYIELIRSIEACPGAYLFYRQIHTVEEQLAAWERQMARIGGLQPGELFPMLDMEPNRVNGDGRVNKKVWNLACDAIGDGWKEQYGGCLLYYSSFFPEFLGAHKGDEGWKWMHEDGYRYVLADYSVPDNQPRTPYQPVVNGKRVWHLHQPQPRETPFYPGKVDVDFFNDEDGFTLADVTIAQEISEPVDPGAPPRPVEPDLMDEGFEKLHEGLKKALEGADVLRNLR